MASKTSGMMFEHLENYLMQACKPACDAGEPDDDREVEEGISPGVDYYTIAQIDHRSVKSARVYICVGRMFVFAIHDKSLETFIKNGNLEYGPTGEQAPEVQAYKDIHKPYVIKTDDREKFIQELVVHIRTDHVFRTWTPALQKSEMMADAGRRSKEATIDLAAPPNGFIKEMDGGYFFFLPNGYEKMGEEEISIQVAEAGDVSELNAREFRQLQQLTEQAARDTIPYTKRMNLRGDMSSWSAWQVWHKVGNRAANNAVIGLRRKFIPSNGNQYHDIFLTLKSKGGGTEVDEEADQAFIETIWKVADSLSPEAPSGVYDRIVISQTAKSLVLDNASLLWFLQRLQPSLLPELGWGWEGAQVQFVRWLIVLLEGENNVPGFPGVSDEEFVELCTDEYGEDMPGLNEEPFADPFKDFINVLPPLTGVSSEAEWERRVAGYLGSCADNGILPEYLTFDKLLQVAAYREHPESWKHVGQEDIDKLKEASETVQHLMEYFLHATKIDPVPGQIVRDDKEQEEEEEEERDDDAPLPPLIKPKLYMRDSEGELEQIVFNVHIMQRLIETGYLRWDFLPRMSDEKQVIEEVQSKELKGNVEKTHPALAPEKSQSDEAEAPAAPKKGKGPTVDSLIQELESRRKNAYQTKEHDLELSPKWQQENNAPKLYDEKVLLTELQQQLYTWKMFSGKDRLPPKDRQKYNQAGIDLMMDIRLIQLCHTRVRLMNEYFEVLISVMDDYDDVDLLCAVAMEIASITNQVYEQRRKTMHARSHFNTAYLLPFSKYFGGVITQRCIVMKIIRNYIMSFDNEYMTLCGMRALINLAALSDECKLQILGGEDGKMLYQIIDWRVGDYANNESVLATFCMLLRNIASSAIGRQTLSRNQLLRGRLKTLMQKFLSQESLKMTSYEPTSSHSRNLMTAEACACLWKMVQPYEPDTSRKERLEKDEQEKNKPGNKKFKPAEPYMESCMLEDVVIGKFDFQAELLALLEAHTNAEDSESSNEVIEKACGLTMALAAADNVIRAMDDHLKDLNEKAVEQIKKFRPKKTIGGKETMRRRMGRPFVAVLCKVLVVKNRSKPVVEKAAGALCVLLSEPDNLVEFKDQKDALESFLSMSITKQEKQLQQLVNRLSLLAQG